MIAFNVPKTANETIKPVLVESLFPEESWTSGRVATVVGTQPSCMAPLQHRQQKPQDMKT